MATPTMGVSSVDRLARSKRPTVERTEIHIPPAPVFPIEAVTGDPRMRAQAVAAFNNALQKWRNDAWSIEAPFIPDAELQADVATLEDTTAKMSTKLDRAAVDIRRAEANITEIDNSITNIDNSITVIEGNAITGTGIVQANGANPPTAILGTPGHVPYWTSVGPPYVALTSPIYTDGTLVGIGTDLPAVLLDVGLAGVTAGVMRLAGGTSGNVTITTATTTGMWTLTLPTTDGAANEFLKTNGSGVTSWSSVVLTTDVTGILPMANGGTNKLMVASAGSVSYSDADSLELTAVGTPGQVLTSQGAATPTWTTPSTVTPSALTRTDDTNITLTLGGSPTVALLAATSLTLGWTGVLSIARGGTNANNFSTSNGVVYYDGTSLVNQNDFLFQSEGLVLGYGTTATSAISVNWTAASSTGTLVLSNLSTDAGAATYIGWDLADTTPTNYSNVAQIIVGKVQNWTSTASTRDAYLTIKVDVNGADTQHLSLQNANIICGDGTDLAQGAVSGFLYLPRISPGVLSAPNGTPTAYAGQIACVIDEDNSTLWAYIGGAWKGVLLA